MVSRVLRAIVTVCALTAGSACADSTGPDRGSPGFTLTLSRAALNIQHNNSATVDVGVTRTGSFTGVVDIVVEGLPAGVTTTPNPSNIGEGSNTITLIFTVFTSAATSTTNLTVRATGNGVAVRTATLRISVTPASPAAVEALGTDVSKL